MRAEAFVSRLDQTPGNALPTSLGQHREAVHVAAPPVPARDDRANHAVILLGHEQPVGTPVEQPPCSRSIIGRLGRGAARMSPELQDSGYVRVRGRTDGHVARFAHANTPLTTGTPIDTSLTRPGPLGSPLRLTPPPATRAAPS